jgi:hypothetical protein
MQVGGRKVLMNEVLFVPENEVATFVCNVGDSDQMSVRLEFPMEPFEEGTLEDKRPEPRFSVEYESPPDSLHVDCIVLKFSNFDRSFGQSLTAPVSVAISEAKEEILFFASIQKLATMRKIEFQFMLGESVA